MDNDCTSGGGSPIRVGCTAALLNSAYSVAGELLHHQSGDKALLQPSSLSHFGVMYKHTLLPASTHSFG